MKLFKLKIANKSCIYEELDLLTKDIYIALNEGTTENLTVSTVEMTEEDYEALSEFQGW